MTPTKHYKVEEIKELRVAVDTLIQEVQNEQEQGHEDVSIENWELRNMASHQALIHLIDAKMWLGKMLEGAGNPFPAELADKAKKD